MAPETIPWGDCAEVEAVPAETPLPRSLARERQARTRQPWTDHELCMRRVRRRLGERGGRHDHAGQSGGESQQNRQQDEQPRQQRGVERKAYTTSDLINGW